jgi:hypothetical protein
MDVLVPDSAETQRLLERIVAGEANAAGRLLERHRRMSLGWSSCD